MTDELIVRSMDVRAIDEDTRTVTGIAVPFDTDTNVGGYTERFAKGAIDSIEDVKLFWQHGEAIGKVIAGRDTDEGYEIDAVISKTARGDEAYVLLKDGVVNRFSVGFQPVKDAMEDGVVVRTKVRLREVSIVNFPAYDGAKILSVRESDGKDSGVRNDTQEINGNERGHIKMTEINETTLSDVADLRGSVEDLERRFAMIGDNASNTDAAPLYRSSGEFLKALGDGSAEARDFATVVDGNVQPAWVSDDLRFKVENRPTVNLFTKAPLPKTDVIKYKKVAGMAGTVGVQANEGDALPYMEVTLDDATANVETYGGYTSLSRQAIEFNNTAVLDLSLRHMVNQYAKVTNAAVRAALVAGTGYNTGTLAADTAAAWLDIVVDSVDLIDANGRGASAEFLLVSSNVYKRLAHMVDGQGRPLFGISGQSVNAIGSANIVQGSLNIGGLTVVKDTGLAANKAFVASSDAITIWEAAGAPFRLADENIINLTKDFSLYGYMAVGITNPLSVVALDVDLV